MKEEISLHAYTTLSILFKGKLKPISSFTDMHGTIHFGRGYPCMETTWSIDGETPFIEQHATKRDRHQQNWDYTCYLHLIEVKQQPCTSTTE